eukprot:351395-Chlamydomonas_euryale.AAC.8
MPQERAHMLLGRGSGGAGRAEGRLGRLARIRVHACEQVAALSGKPVRLQRHWIPGRRTSLPDRAASCAHP